MNESSHRHCMHRFSRYDRDESDVIDGDDVCAQFELARPRKSQLLVVGEAAVVKEQAFGILAYCCGSQCKDVYLFTDTFEEKSHGGPHPKLRVRDNKSW